MNKVLITGASSGIGLQTAVLLASEGYYVYAVARQIDKLEELKRYGIKPYYMDLSDETSIKEVTQNILEDSQGIDILINNAGFGVFVSIEDVEISTARKQLEVNLFGLAELTKLVLPYMREKGRGRIINVSSVAGRAVFFMGGWYHVSKYGLEALSDVLRMELTPFGIDVVLIEPGAIKTNWGLIAARYLKESAKSGAYEDLAKIQAKRLEKNYSKNPFFSEPKIVAKVIKQAVVAKRVKARYLVGFGARVIILLKHVLPDKIFDALMMIGIKKG